MNKRINNFFLYYTIFLVLGCRNSASSESEIIGKWLSKTKAEFIFNERGLFDATDLPASVFFVDPKFIGQKFSGNGTWKIRKGQTNWEIYLHFNEISNDYKGYEVTLIRVSKQ